MKFTIEYTGKTIGQFPMSQFNPSPDSAPAWEVVDANGASRFVGTYDMCQMFLNSR
jgi:hypothetical protein